MMSHNQDNGDAKNKQDVAHESNRKAAYKGFGSFHSDNVETLIKLPASEYRIPEYLPSWARYDDDHFFREQERVKASILCKQQVEEDQRRTAAAIAKAKELASAQEQAVKNESCSSSSSASPEGQYVTATFHDATQLTLGATIRHSHWNLDPDWCFLNHGAFGGALKAATRIKRQYEDLMESQPLRFVDRQLLPLLVHATRSLAAFIGARPQDIVLTPNATTALNAAVTASVRNPADKVIFLDTIYNATWKMLVQRCDRDYGVDCTGDEVPLLEFLKFCNGGSGCMEKNVLRCREATLDYLEKSIPDDVTVIVLDHIASNSALTLPIFDLVIPMLWKTKKQLKHLIIDGAHAPLSIPLDFSKLRDDQLPTMYVGNMHKWMASPKAVGFMWAHPRVQSHTHSVVVSHGSREGFISEFIWNGTTDYGAALTIPTLTDFWSRVIPAPIARAYCSQLLNDAAMMLCEAFGVCPLKLSNEICFMKLVRLPSALQPDKGISSKYIQDTLHGVYRVEVPIKELDGVMYVRLSAHVYNCMADYVKFRAAILDIAQHLQQNHNHDEFGNEQK